MRGQQHFGRWRFEAQDHAGEGLARRYLQINGEWRDHLLFALLEDDARVA